MRRAIAARQLHEAQPVAVRVAAPWSRYRRRPRGPGRGRPAGRHDADGYSFHDRSPRRQAARNPRWVTGECERPVRWHGAQERTRTSTPLRPLAPEASASTNSATWAARAGSCMSSAGARQLESAVGRPAWHLRDGVRRRHNEAEEPWRQGGRRFSAVPASSVATSSSDWPSRAIIRVPSRHTARALFLKPLGGVGQINVEAWNLVDGQRGRAAGHRRRCRGQPGRHPVRERAGISTGLQARFPGEVGAAAARPGVARARALSAIGADRTRKAAYGRTKAAGEAAVRRTFPEATIMRPSIVFGPEDNFFNRFARDAGCRRRCR